MSSSERSWRSSQTCTPVSASINCVAMRTRLPNLRSADLLDLQPSLCPGPERACLADGLGRDHSGQGDAAGRGREGFKRVEEIFAKFPITQT